MVSAFRRNIRSFLRVNKPSSILKEFTSYRLWLDLGLEVIVTGFFIFAFFALFVRWDNRPEVTIVQVGLTVGIVVSMLLEMSWHWGEVHINQSITLMHAVLGLNSIPTGMSPHHTHIHTYIHKHIHKYIHKYIHTYIHTYERTHAHTHAHACMHACIHTYIHIRTYIHTHIHLVKSIKLSGILSNPCFTQEFD